MISPKLLLPYNFSLYDEKSVDFVASIFCRQPELEVTLFHAYTPLPDFETSDGTVMGKLKQNLSYLNQKIADGENALKATAEKLCRNGFSKDRVRYLYRPRKKDVAAEIIDLAVQDRFQFLVLNRKPGRITRFFSGSVSSRVLSSAKNVTVCVVT